MGTDCSTSCPRSARGFVPGPRGGADTVGVEKPLSNSARATAGLPPVSSAQRPTRLPGVALAQKPGLDSPDAREAPRLAYPIGKTRQRLSGWLCEAFGCE